MELKRSRKNILRCGGSVATVLLHCLLYACYSECRTLVLDEIDKEIEGSMWVFFEKYPICLKIMVNCLLFLYSFEQLHGY